MQRELKSLERDGPRRLRAANFELALAFF